MAQAFRTYLASNVKTNDSSNSKNHGKYGHPAVAVFDVFGKGWVAYAGRESTQTYGLQYGWGCLIDYTTACKTKYSIFQ